MSSVPPRGDADLRLHGVEVGAEGRLALLGDDDVERVGDLLVAQGHLGVGADLGDGLLGEARAVLQAEERREADDALVDERDADRVGCGTHLSACLLLPYGSVCPLQGLWWFGRLLRPIQWSLCSVSHCVH